MCAVCCVLCRGKACDGPGWVGKQPGPNDSRLPSWRGFCSIWESELWTGAVGCGLQRPASETIENKRAKFDNELMMMMMDGDERAWLGGLAPTVGDATEVRRSHRALMTDARLPRAAVIYRRFPLAGCGGSKEGYLLLHDQVLAHKSPFFFFFAVSFLCMFLILQCHY